MPDNRVRPLVYFRDMLGKIVAVGLVAVISAQFQAAALVLVVLIGKAIATGHHRFTGGIGPLHLDVATNTLMVLCTIAICVAAILDSALAWVRSKINSKWDFEHREGIVAEYMQADYATQSAERLGTLSMITSYVTRAAGVLGALTTAFVASITLTMYVAFAFLLDFRAALLMLGTTAGLALLLRPLMRRTKQYGRTLSSALVDYGREVTEATRMIRDVRVFCALDPVGRRLTHISSRVRKVRQRAVFVNAIVSPIYQYIGLLVVIGALAAAESIGTFEIVQLGAIALLLVRGMSFSQAVQGAYQNIVEGLPYIERLEDMRAVYKSHRAQDGTIVLETVHGLELDEVRYSYDGKVDALAGVSASFRVGEVVGIVGPSGGGKSTLSQLLVRLREPTGGEIRVNGVASGEYKLSSWYRHVSLVAQDPRLLHGSVADNISFLEPMISRQQVIDAAKAAGVHEVIEVLDHGYDTLIGPAFRDLSGGQIQRIGIARALARGAQILVLDEPTSALDVHSEQVIQSTLEGLRGHALVLIIAHRLSTLSICDRIMVLRDGQIETMGTLSEVSERSAFFRRALDAGTLEIGVGERPEVVSPDEA
jgi:ABC-type multidrug transport system fused ATPase/permease subunit